jgi:hypothetical protein
LEVLTSSHMSIIPTADIGDAQWKTDIVGYEEKSIKDGWGLGKIVSVENHPFEVFCVILRQGRIITWGIRLSLCRW